MIRRREQTQRGGVVHTGEDVLERKLNVAGIKSRRLDEGQVVLAYTDCQRQDCPVSCLLKLCRLTRKRLGLFRRHGPQMPQIALVTDQHDDDVGVGVVAQLLEPPRDILVGLVFADVVDEQRADGATVVRRGDGAVPLLAGGIPDLRLNGLGVDLDRTGSELDADGRLGIEIELVARESAQQVGLSDARVSDQDDCEGNLSVSLGLVGWRRGKRGRRGRLKGVAAVALRGGLPLKRNC